MLKSEVLKINAKCQNGFSLNVFMAAVWKEKLLYKAIELEGTADAEHENKVIIFKLQFGEVTEGRGWSAKKIGVAPFLWIETQHPLKNSKLASVQTVASAQIGETVQRKSLAALQKLTSKFNTEICKYLFNKVSTGNENPGPRCVFNLNDEAANARLIEALKAI